MKKILLIFVLVVGLFGSETEEIGKPFIEKGQGLVKSAVLDPDGEHFYTLKGETVTKWQLEPIKKVYSFKTGVEPAIFSIGYQISVTPDSKKMILRSMDTIVLLDLENKKIIKSVKEKTFILAPKFYLGVYTTTKAINKI